VSEDTITTDAEKDAEELLRETGMGVSTLTPDTLIDLLAMAWMRGNKAGIKWCREVAEQA
jgi:hypothetical protein